jgi:predicted aspartyl protease
VGRRQAVIGVRGRRAGAILGAVLAVLALTAADCAVTNTRPGAAPSAGSAGSGESGASGESGERRRSRPGEVSVPLKVITNGGDTMVLVPVRVNGRGPYDFVLDTGATTSTVSESLMRRLELPSTGATAHVRGVAGDTVVPVVTVRRWTLGGQRLRGRSLPVLDLGGNFGAGQVNGLLGSDELRPFGSVRLDYENRRLVLRADR